MYFKIKKNHRYVTKYYLKKTNMVVLDSSKESRITSSSSLFFMLSLSLWFSFKDAKGNGPLDTFFVCII
jgi:hypothetical protein